MEVSQLEVDGAFSGESYTNGPPAVKGPLTKKSFQPSYYFLGGYNYNVLFRVGVDYQIF